MPTKEKSKETIIENNKLHKNFFALAFLILPKVSR